jgi:undecaprenyl-phosphate 4-deoxy-4-formamido-L-arabinose transferase
VSDPVSQQAGQRGAEGGAPAAVKRVSVVIPVYNGAATVASLVERIREEFPPSRELEVVLVNDGSADASAAVCAELARRHPWVRFVDLARNFGEHNAVMAGLRYASGDCAVIVDDDFQNPPSEVMRLVHRLEEGYDVVFAEYERKEHSLLRNLGSAFHNAVATVLLRKDPGLYLSSFKALARFAIDEVVRYEGPYPYVDGLILRATRNYATQRVRHEPRRAGRSNYTMRRLVALWLNMFTNFSILPLRIASLAGLAFAAVGFLLAVAFAVEKLRNPDLPAGWASLVVTLLVVSGVQLFALGLLGEYLGRLFLKDNGSPMFVVRRTLNCDGPGDPRR